MTLASDSPSPEGFPIAKLTELENKLKDKGYTIIPLRIFLSEKGLFKMEIGLARGKKLYDKRETIKDRDTQREIKRFLK